MAEQQPPDAGSIETAEELKEQGNKAFNEKRFQDAEELYSKAIELDPAIFQLYGNRSAARLQLKKTAEALADAQRCVELAPGYVKGYHRLACAHQAQGSHPRETVQAYQEALKADSKSQWVAKQLRQARDALNHHWRTNSITGGTEEWKEIFISLTEPRERMFTLACFWNCSSKQERLLIFRRFLDIIGNSPDDARIAPASEEYTEDHMQELPMDNYVDFEPVQPWMDFYTSQESTEKMNTFQLMWELTSDQEKTVIINDLKHFFLVPMLREKGLISDDMIEENGNGEDSFSPET
uniref:RNA-polymerase II-associated protein 3-like C-terminal domain-containing protein n=1 Tax=Fibrocapsa japonica TaxID=94617 RepID=A0A7S2XUE6_9STRA|mmetsp:Transcript_12955/g.19131  ORF Transcript_12955/g.19131 Transcript_12955/m.19131 type:complete len:295 (+) Transcript_12955:64-948(+)|eukprot:CAMPEP_0113945092 /NCGR_PEP_ID=MMETSP1339-20121228/38481_1 /TAXON_ID=94617 /ORGANISM="Fibrocapsa japonica" /LENGTH=294 /DNA_ID=CAMNT_0000950499 /DNA_START=29 /DNA_END=913 /DNA_ORIENTATION=- /assembly_acc=CAM_ASM_000762